MLYSFTTRQQGKEPLSSCNLLKMVSIRDLEVGIFYSAKPRERSARKEWRKPSQWRNFSSWFLKFLLHQCSIWTTQKLMYSTCWLNNMGLQQKSLWYYQRNSSHLFLLFKRNGGGKSAVSALHFHLVIVKHSSCNLKRSVLNGKKMYLDVSSNTLILSAS